MLLEQLLIAGVAVLVGALVQGLIGFGIGPVAAPVLVLIDSSLVPAALLLVTVPHPLMSVARELDFVDWRGLGWILMGRIPGTAVGAYSVTILSARLLGVLVASAVLIAVVASVVRWTPRMTRQALVVGGLISGAFGTSTAIGGPPIAILYQGSTGPRLRATLSGASFFGVMISIGALGIAGEISRRDVGIAVVLLPFLISGFAVSGPLRRLVDRGGIRIAVLLLSTTAAIALVARACFV